MWNADDWLGGLPRPEHRGRDGVILVDPRYETGRFPTVIVYESNDIPGDGSSAFKRYSEQRVLRMQIGVRFRSSRPLAFEKAMALRLALIHSALLRSLIDA